MVDILAVNIGSSSLKFALYPVSAGEQVLSAPVSGQFEGLEPGGRPRLQMTADGQRSSLVVDPVGRSPIQSALMVLNGVLKDLLQGRKLAAVAHRIVHGGPLFGEPVLLDDKVVRQLEGFKSLAPLHQPHNLAGVSAFREHFPQTPQIGCFDTAFHRTAHPLETRFALPETLYEQGIRRYGFHGLSYDYVAGRLRRLTARASDRLLMAHLGNGSSLCAALGGQSVATTMGFSALDGLMMGSRCGALDPGVVLYLLEQGWDHPRIEQLLYRESGLLGVSGLSADMRTLRQSGNPSAQLAIDLYVHRIRREGGALTAVLQGLDAVAFTGGIGEHDAQTRSAVCAGWGFLGVKIDEDANRQGHFDAARAIHAPESAVEVWVMPTDEGRVAAEAALGVLNAR